VKQTLDFLNKQTNINSNDAIKIGGETIKNPVKQLPKLDNEGNIIRSSPTRHPILEKD
jgi:hypothetical protein